MLSRRASSHSMNERMSRVINDTFVVCDWWRYNFGELSNFAFVLRAVLTHSPISCPPERPFIIFNATFDADQKSSFGDYIDLSIHVVAVQQTRCVDLHQSLCTREYQYREVTV